VGLAACGGGSPDGVAVRIGDVAIERSNVEHWASVVTGGHAPFGSLARRRALRRQALRLLIAADWLIGEAATQGLELSERAVARRLALRERSSFPGGQAELHEFLKATGQTTSDIELEARAELAAAELRQAITSSLPPITAAEVGGYYESHGRQFTTPEERTVEISNRKTLAALLRLKREVAAGRRLLQAGTRFSLERTDGPAGPLTRAIYKATPRELVGPVKQGVDYFLFEVTRITPARQRSLREVRGAIVRRLQAKGQHRAIARFTNAWIRRWHARTDCAPGYVIDRCRQYSAAVPREVPLGLP
jgi:foldase protein PrsA